MRKPLVFTVILVMVLSLLSTAALAGGLIATPDFVEISVGSGGSASQTFTVAGATGPLQFAASKPYLSATTADNKNVKVTVNAAGLAVGLSELATLTVKSGGAELQVPISVTVTGSGSGGTAFTAEPTRIDLGSVAPGSKKIARVKVTTAAAGSFSAVVSTTQPWLTVQPSTITSAEQTLLVQVDIANLAAGSTVTGAIRIAGGPLGTLEIPVLVTVAAPAAPPEAVTSTLFRDVPADHWAARAIAFMQSRKIITGFEDGTFRPDLGVTREQFARVLVAALQLPLVDRPQTPSFRDVPANRWSYVYVETAKPIMTYYADGTFHPSELATREDIAAALVRAQGLDKEAPPDPAELDVLFSDASSISADLKVLVAQAVDHKLISGYDDGTFRPQEKVTRAQMASLLYRAMNNTSLGGKTAPGGQVPNPPVGTGGSSTGNGGATSNGGTTGSGSGGGSSQGSGSGTGGAAGVVPPVQATPGTDGYGLGSAPASWPADSTVKVYTLAGGVGKGSQDGPVSQATFDELMSVQIGSDGAVYVQQSSWNHARIRKIANQQVVTVWQAPPRLGYLAGWAVRGSALYTGLHFQSSVYDEIVVRRHALQGGEDDREIADLNGGGWNVNTASFLVTAAGNIILKATSVYSIRRIDAKDNVTNIADSEENGALGSLLAVDETGGRILLFDWGNVKEMRLFPRNTTTLLEPPDRMGLSLASVNHRGGLYAYDSGSGAFYRWQPGETKWTKMFQLDRISYVDSRPIEDNGVEAMAVDAKGNIILLDRGNQSIRYVQIFP